MVVLDINGVHMIRVKATESKLCVVDDVQERPALLLGGGLLLLVHTLARRDHLAQPRVLRLRELSEEGEELVRQVVLVLERRLVLLVPGLRRAARRGGGQCRWSVVRDRRRDQA